jgi:hypothetical protein
MAYTGKNDIERAADCAGIFESIEKNRIKQGLPQKFVGPIRCAELHSGSVKLVGPASRFDTTATENAVVLIIATHHLESDGYFCRTHLQTKRAYRFRYARVDSDLSSRTAEN